MTASKIFPCFDQPSLKAIIEVRTISPKNWIVVSNGREGTISIDKKEINELLEKRRIIKSIADSFDENAYQMHTFEQTSKISPHSFAVFAGPYKIFKGKEEGIGAVPMSIYCLESSYEFLSKFAEPVIFQQIVQKGMLFAQKSFASRFPYPKCDFVFLPLQFSQIRTFSGISLINDDKNYSANSDFILSLVECIVKGWIFNSISPKWWNSLNLFDAVAQYITLRIFVECPDFAQYKNSAILESICDLNAFDSQIAIENLINCADETELLMKNDNKKGISIIKSLENEFGETIVKNAVIELNKKYKDKCCEITDFVNCLKTAGKKTKISPDKFDKWSQIWLESKSANILKIEELKTGETDLKNYAKISQISQEPNYKQYCLDFMLYKLSPEFSQITFPKIIINDAEKFDFELKNEIGKQDFAILNTEQTFVKQYLSKESLDILKEKINLIENPLVKIIIYQNLALMVIDQQISASFFIDFISNNLPHEKDALLYEKILKYALQIIEECVPFENKTQECEKVLSKLYAPKSITINMVKLAYFSDTYKAEILKLLQEADFENLPIKVKELILRNFAISDKETKENKIKLLEKYNTQISQTYLKKLKWYIKLEPNDNKNVKFKNYLKELLSSFNKGIIQEAGVGKKIIVSGFKNYEQSNILNIKDFYEFKDTENLIANLPDLFEQVFFLIYYEK